MEPETPPHHQRFWRIITTDGVLHLAHAHYPVGIVLCGPVQQSDIRSVHDRGAFAGPYDRLCWICDQKRAL